MSSAIETVTARPTTNNLQWGLWWRQIRAILRIEVKKNFWGKRALLIYLFAAIPVLLMFLLTFADEDSAADITKNWNGAQEVFANIFEALILRTMVFFGCAWIFMNLFRGEVVDRSLHYYFLSSLRREVLVIGKNNPTAVAIIAKTIRFLSSLSNLVRYSISFPVSLIVLIIHSEILSGT